MLNLSVLQKVIPGLPDSWVTTQNKRAKLVARCRRYAEGDHDGKLTNEMKELLRSAVELDTESSPFADNYMAGVISAMVDRLQLQAVRSDDDETINEWIDDLLSYNRLDAMQAAVFEAAIRDGDSYLMVGFDENADKPILTLEDAFDGDAGMLVWYASTSYNVIKAAIKVWAIDADSLRINIYYPDRIEKYWTSIYANAAGGALTQWNGTPEEPEQPIQTYGAPLGVPVVHIRNRAYKQYGKSEIAGAIPLQDALNRTLQSLVMNSEYAGFPILVARGFPPPTALKPGSIVTISGDQPLTKDLTADLARLEAGSNTEFLATAQWLAGEIERVTSTPSPESVAPTSSGEARKHAEIRLVGKIKRFQVVAGNAFEDAIKLAAAMQALYGREKPPMANAWQLSAQWTSPELRDDTGIVERAMLLRDIVGDAEVLRMVAPVYGYSEQDINRILDEKAQSETSRIAQLGSALPAFSLTAGELTPNDQNQDGAQ